MATVTRDELQEDLKRYRAESRALAGQYEPLWGAEYGEDSLECLIRFVTECCWTLDEETGRIEQIPDLPHVRFWCAVWYHSRATGKTWFLEKSRRILASWVISACEVWSMGVKVETRIVCGLNYAKTAQQVWRTAFLYRQAVYNKGFKIADCTPRGGNYMAQDVREVIFPNGSFIKGLNQETDTFQGSGFAGIRMEELSHFDHVGAMLGQAYIITHGRTDVIGGHIVGVTNAYPNQEWLESKEIAEVIANKDHTWTPEIAVA